MTAQTITRPRKSTTQAQADRRPRWLSYPEAAELSTLSVRSLKRLTAAGKLPCTWWAARFCGSRRPTWKRCSCPPTSAGVGEGSRRVDRRARSCGSPELSRPPRHTSH